MAVRTPLTDLIERRSKELGLDRLALGLRLGYGNPAKAVGRVLALGEGYVNNQRSRSALSRLPEVLEVHPDEVAKAVEGTKALLAERKRQTQEALRKAHEEAEARWRASFRPHAIIQTELRVPTQICICGMTGGPSRWLRIDFDLTKPPITFVRQALDALPTKAIAAGGRAVPFFGEVLGLIVNFSPDQAVRCDLEGRPIEVLERAYRIGHVGLSIGGRPVSPTIAKILGTG